MAIAVVALIAATVPAIVGTSDSDVDLSRNIVAGPPQLESSLGSLVANEIITQLQVGTVTRQQVVSVFEEVGADLALHGNGTFEDPLKRAERIAVEINSGLRSEAHVRQAIASLAAGQQQWVSRPQSFLEIVEMVRGFFGTAGVAIETPVESEATRLERIAGQIVSGDRALAEVQGTVQGIAAGRVVFDPNGPAQFGGGSVAPDGTSAGPAPQPVASPATTGPERDCPNDDAAESGDHHDHAGGPEGRDRGSQADDDHAAEDGAHAAEGDYHDND